ncbi:hypothetical protein NW762_012459 [Fusarium torreyae]|uniref:ABC transporter n=1 Tax=Fusarium torreyae TaxID=1237075 RepID=A0A9W8RP11_9HYPO|nr:hypothetical protein NW762_012459 [Fusarium torreyae]
MGDLYALDEAMSASNLYARVKQLEIKRPAASTSARLSWSMFSTLLVPLLLAVVPRIAVIGFTFCQPFLIQTILAYLESPSEPKNGYGLIGAAVIIYTGIAISNALYFYWQERFVCMARGILFTAVYNKTISLPIADVSDSAVLTLMNSDIERIKMGLLPLHEYWANTIEVILASWLLEKQIGAAFVAPIVVIVLCIIASGGIASITGRRQVAWMKAIEERVATTANAISTIKSLRISGMTSAVEKLIQESRENELRIGGKWRLMLVIAVTLSFTPMTIGPLMAFAVTSRSLEVTRIFPSLAFIMLLAMPLSNLFQNIPGLLSALTCLGRIDAYMKKESRSDPRTMHQHVSYPEEKVNMSGKVPALEVIKGNFGWTAEHNVLQNVNIKIPTSSLTIVLGPVASGKSTLLKAFLGETAFSSGTTKVGVDFRRIGYCDQTPFLSNDSIRANIIGHAPFHATRYQEALYSTALEADLKQLPQGDRSTVGGNGISLSGGQRQRLALARALYLQADLYLLDDILSGIDATTSALVFQRTMGIDGILTRRKSTVVLCTHNEQYLQFADNIITISGDGSLTEAENNTRIDNERLYNEPDKQVLHPDPEMQQLVSPNDSAEVCPQNDARRTGDFAVYRHYFASMANWIIISFLLSCCCYGFTSNFPTAWLKYWSADVIRPKPQHSGAFYVGIYALLQTSCLLSLTAVVLLCTQSMISQTGSRLHRSALQTVIGASLRFLTLVDTGTVTNHFAQDLTLVDSELPLSLVNFSLSLFTLVGMAAVIAIASPWLAVAYPVLIGVVYYIQLFYLRTSRQLRILELESKAPLL